MDWPFAPPRRRAVSVEFAAEPELGSWYTDEEITAAAAAMRAQSDWRRAQPGTLRDEFETAFAAFIGARHAVSLNGAGTGLDLMIRCLDVEPGDEVLSGVLNFPGTHLAVIGGGARLVLCESDPRTLNIDVEDVERRITRQTRALLVTHMNGLPADIDALLAIAERHSHPRHGPLKVIFDAARACGARFKGGRIGTEGWATVFSFHRRKLMTTLGEGGMVTTDDDELAARLRRHRAFGDGVAWGSNYKMTDVQAAVGLVQLRRLDEMNALRVARAEERSALLAGTPWLGLPPHPTDRSHLFYFYTVHVPEDWPVDARDRVMETLERDYAVGTVVANPPTYQENRLIWEHVAGCRLPRSERTAQRILSVSLHPKMTVDQNRRIAEAVGSAMAYVGKAAYQ